jgi:multiple sugar transport system ATP-binding protein
MTLGHRVAVMNQGRLQQFDPPLAIYNQPANRFVAGFVGSPTMNFLEGEIDLAGGRFVTPQIALPVTESQLEIFKRRGTKPVTLGIRPEHISVSLDERDGWQRASVYVTELMGSETFVILQIDKTRLVARAPGEFRADTDRQAWIEFDMNKAHWFDSDSGKRI